MPPNKGEATLQYSEARGTDSMSKEHFFDGEKVQYDQDIKWFNVVALFLVHVLTTYALVVGLPLVKASTVTFCNYTSRFRMILYNFIAARLVILGSRESESDLLLYLLRVM